MPAVRPSVHPTVASYHYIGCLSPYDTEAQLEATPTPRTPAQDINEPFTTPPAYKKRRSPNAFILFRSHVITNKFYPSDMKHQNDISRFVAEMWKSVSASERAVFFRKAEEEKIRYEIEGHVETQKKRTRKPRPPKRAEQVPQLDAPCNLPQALASSPSSIEDNGTPVEVHCAPTLYFYTPLRNASASPPRAPQSNSPSLLGWDLQADSHGPHPEGRVFATPEWLSPSQVFSFPPANSGVSHNDVAAFDNALQLELDFLLSSDMTMSMPTDAYPDITTTFEYLPSFNPLPYPFDGCNIPLAPF